MGVRCAPVACAAAGLFVCLAAGLAPPSIAVGSREAADEAGLRVLIDRAQWKDAETAARRLVAAREAADGPESLACAQALDLLVEILWRSGLWSGPEPVALAERAVTIKEARRGPDSLEVAASLINLGVIQRLTGSSIAARDSLERALAIRQRVLGPAHPAVAEAQVQVAWSISEQGEVGRAIDLHERALHTRETLLGPDHPLVADSLTAFGGVVRNAGDFGKAVALHERALRIRRRALPAGHPDTAQSIFSLADALHRNGDLTGALPLYEESQRLREAAATTDPMRLSEVLLDRADLLADLGDMEAARPLYERGLRLRLETVGTNHWLTGLGEHALATFLALAGEEEQAREHFETAIATWDATLPPGHPLRALGRQDLGILLRRSGDPEAARRVLQESIDAWTIAPIPDHPFSGHAYMALGALLRDSGDLSASRAMLDRAIEILGTTLGPDHPRHSEALLERARLSWREGKDLPALDDALRAEEALRANLRSTIRGLSEGEALRYQDIMLSGLDLALSILEAGDPAVVGPVSRVAVADALFRSRALVLDEMVTRHRSIVRTDNPKIQRLAAAVEHARRNYARLLVAGPSPMDPRGYPALLTAARLEVERTERGLAATSRPFVLDQERRNPTFEAVARAIPPGTALVSYVAYRRYDRRGSAGAGVPSYLALVRPALPGAPIVVPLGPAADLEAGVERWRRAVSSAPDNPQADAAYRLVAQAIRRTLWDPAAARIGAAARVLVVPDGAVHAISLATLVDDEGRFLLETGPTFHHLSSERDMLVAAGPTASGHGLLALGGPDFDAGPPAPRTAPIPAPAPAAGDSVVDAAIRSAATADPCAAWAAFTFAPLPGAAAEAEHVREVWMAPHARHRGRAGPVVVLIGPDATEGNLSRSAAGKRVLHLATHAFFVPDRCPGPAAPQTAALRGGAPAGPIAAATPFRVAGLALAGANRRGTAASGAADDGLLTAEEVAALDLSAVEWVVLSGCQTGVGLARSGEGILGLRRSFQVAGARTLILSLWPVSDNVTRGWMESLYDHRARGSATADALRQASLDDVRERRRAGVTAHPFFWGAFVAAGDWR